jgi:hypothetical protein
VEDVLVFFIASILLE